MIKKIGRSKNHDRSLSRQYRYHQGALNDLKSVEKYDDGNTGTQSKSIGSMTPSILGDKSEEFWCKQLVEVRITIVLTLAIVSVGIAASTESRNWYYLSEITNYVL